MGAITDAIRWATGQREHVQTFEVKIAEEDSPIDIFSEQLKIVEDADLDSLNVDLNYNTRRALLMRAFNDYIPILRRLYGG